MPDLIKELAPLAAIVSALCAIFVAVRAGRWRRSEEWTSMVNRVGELEGCYKKVEGDIRRIESDIGQLPTQADIARLDGKLNGISSEIKAANAGIDRLEGYFLQKGMERTGS